VEVAQFDEGWICLLHAGGAAAAAAVVGGPPRFRAQTLASGMYVRAAQEAAAAAAGPEGAAQEETEAAPAPEPETGRVEGADVGRGSVEVGPKIPAH
jgi:hypothetical protein